MISDPGATPFDLRFRLFGVDVRVHPFFWLMSVLLGWGSTRQPVFSNNGLPELLLWVGACFVSILLHEFGHVWMGQAFGSDGHIVLHGMGGLAIGSSAVESPWKRILVIAAGPGIQLALWAALRYVLIPFSPSLGLLQYPAVRLLLVFLILINLYWPILNLLPVWPLDGGQITREVSVLASPRRGLLFSLWLSLVVAAVLAVNAFIGDRGEPFLPHYAPTGLWAGILFALFAYGSWQAIQAEQSRRYYERDALPWER